MPYETRYEPRNIGLEERALSVIAGLALAAAAVRPRPNPLLSVAALLGGSYLAYRGATGYCPVKATLERLEDRRDPERIARMV